MAENVERLDQLKPETEREQMLFDLGNTTATVQVLNHVVKTIRQYGENNSNEAVAQVFENMAQQADKGELLADGSPLKPLIDKAVAEQDGRSS